jgi:signal transduction histidine kinase
MMSERERDEQRLPGDRFLDHMYLVWAVIFYVALGLNLAAALAYAPGGLGGWPLASALLLVAGSAALFQGIFWRFASRIDAWPMAWRPALAYFGGQLLILAGLLSISDSFVGLGFALMGQSFGVLRPRHWALPLVPLVALLARPLGWLDLDAGTDWVGLGLLGLLLGIWLFVASLLSLLFTQRFRLMGLVRELREARAGLEAAAAQQEELAVLRERTRLAREMHDSIGHALVSVNVKLEAAERLYRVDPARGSAELEATRSLVRESMTALRRSIADLRAPLPDHRDLPVALRRLAQEVSARGALAVTVDTGPDEACPSPAVAEALYLLAREALVNVERHAGASRATVRVAHDGAAWSLEVADDGVGVRPADLRRPGHFGVVGMRERAAALGGALHVAAAPRGGTRVVATIPERENGGL